MKPEPPPLTIGSPCPKRWDDLRGDATTRFCEECGLHVHNLSTMGAPERDRFVAGAGEHSCIAYELRPDGSMVTPSRWDALLFPFRQIRWAMAALFAASLPFLFTACSLRRTMGKPAPSCASPADSKAEANSQPMTLGKIRPLSTPTPQPHQAVHRMGGGPQ